MRVASLVIGLIAGLLGIAVAILFFAYGNALVGQHAASGGYTTTAGWIGLVFALAGILGAGLVMNRPRAGAALMLLATIGLAFGTAVFALVTGSLFLIAAILGFLSRERRPATA